LKLIEEFKQQIEELNKKSKTIEETNSLLQSQNEESKKSNSDLVSSD
jgi:hypothetical protein